ncbi:MAG: hypothetical protein NT015_12120 [Alphaproteobacteria bacterium]|nr:hypothetical protein [Alphaproteobacteria bacterium]
MKNALVAMAVAVALAGCGTTQSSSDYSIMTGGRSPNANVERMAAAAARYPLGSQQNPIRVNMPPGERAYLGRLRCTDGAAPTFERQGNGGIGAFGSIVDIYAVVCANGEPRQSTIWMDMYHPQHNETAAPPGFTIVAQ